ncbi:MAG: hypothetical protein O7G87_17020, partial [bacterium]|nr:hypothetical protein [bacterium]
MLSTFLQFIPGGDTPSVSVPEGAPLLDGGDTHFQAVLQEAQQQLDGSATTALPPSDSSGTPYPSLAELIAEFLAESDIPPETASDIREEAQNPEVDIPILPQSEHPPDVGLEPTGENSTPVAQTVGPVEEAPPPIGRQLPPEHPAPVQTEHSVANAQTQERPVQEHPATPAPEPERPAVESPSPSGQTSPHPIQEADWTPSNEPWTPPETHHPAPGWTVSDNQSVSPNPPDRTTQPMPHSQVVRSEVESGVSAPTIPTPKPDLQPEGDLPATDKDVSAASSPPAFETQAAQAVPPPVLSDNPQTEAQPVIRPDRLADPMPEAESLERSVLLSQAEPQPGSESPRSDVAEQGDWPTASEQPVRTSRQIPIPSAGTQTTPEPVVSDQHHQNTPVWPSAQPQVQPGSPAPSSTKPPPASPERPVWTGQEQRSVQPPVVSRTSVQENGTPEIRPPSVKDQTPVSENPIQPPQTRPETPRIPVIGATDFQPPVSEQGPEITSERAATPGIQHPPEHTPVSTQPAPNPTLVDPQPVSNPLPVTQKEGIPVAQQAKRQTPAVNTPMPVTQTEYTPSVAQQAEHQTPAVNKPVVNTPPVTPTPQPVGNPQVNTPPVNTPMPVTQTEYTPSVAQQAEHQTPAVNKPVVNTPPVN